MAPAGKRVYVSGGGLGGLAFALGLLRLCQEQGVSPLPKVRVFERDVSADARSTQGYSLSVRGDSGGLQVALFRALPVLPCGSLFGLA